MHGPELEVTQRQIAVGTHLRLVDEHMREAVHRLDAVALLVNLGEVHILAVIVEVPGGLPQLGAQNLRPHDDIVTAPQMLAAFEIFDDGAQQRPLRDAR